MSAIIASAAIAPQMTAPIMPAFTSSLPGSYQKTEENTPAQKAAQTSHFVIRKA